MRHYSVIHTNGGKGIIYILVYTYYKTSILQCTCEPKKSDAKLWVHDVNFMKIHVSWKFSTIW